MHRKALTLIELLLVIAIIGVMLALLLPAVQAARESTRRIKCSSNLRQLGLALHNYAGVHGVLPSAGRANYTVHVRLLPYLEQEAVYRQIDFSVNGLDYQGELLSHRIDVFECPSDGSDFSQGGRFLAATNYHANIGSGMQKYGNNGVFMFSSDFPGYLPHMPVAAITDGLSQTAMIAEVLAANGRVHPRRSMWMVDNFGGADDFDQFAAVCEEAPLASSPNAYALKAHHRGRPWPISGPGWMVYNHILPPNSASCYRTQSPRFSILTATSFHGPVLNIAMADASIQTVDGSIDLTVWRAIGSRAGNP